MNQELTTTAQSSAIQAKATKYNEADIRQEMSILRAAFPRLDAPDEGLRALIIASRFSGLNPFRGEIYYIPKVGVTVASKIKAADAVAWAQSHGNTLNIRFEKLNELHPEYQSVQPKQGDVAWVCIIISSKARQDYFNWRIQMIDELKALGYQRNELEAQLNERCGKTAPETRAVGIIRGAEEFGDKFQKATVFTRDDRAQKRALQKALNIGGYAAPDMRNYGGARIEDERSAAESTIESPYRVVESGVSGAAEYQHDMEQQSYREDDSSPEAVTPTTDAPTPATLKPVSQRNRQIASALHDQIETLRTVDLKTASPEARTKWTNDLKTIIQDVNTQLVLRNIDILRKPKDATDAWSLARTGVSMLVDHDQEAAIEQDDKPAPLSESMAVATVVLTDDDEIASTMRVMNES